MATAAAAAGLHRPSDLGRRLAHSQGPRGVRLTVVPGYSVAKKKGAGLAAAREGSSGRFGQGSDCAAGHVAAVIGVGDVPDRPASRGASQQSKRGRVKLPRVAVVSLEL